MRLFIIVPMFGVAGEELDLRLENWADWFGSTDPDVPYDENWGWVQLRRRYNLSDLDALTLLPGHDIAMRRESDDAVLIRMPQREGARLEKGLSVRLALIAALDQTDRRSGGMAARRDAKCILIDGSGAFDFNNIFKIMDVLTGKSVDTPLDVVLGTRPPGESGMTVERKAIEEFEQFIIASAIPRAKEALSSLPWPDGQAGCWGISLNALTLMPLTALGYELELDLLTSGVSSGVSIGYSLPLQMLPRRQTSVSDDPLPMSMGKLEFLQAKLGVGADRIARLWSDFDDAFPETARLIRPEYRNQVTNRGTQMVRRSPAPSETNASGATPSSS